jgi:hypothetical protein
VHNWLKNMLKIKIFTETAEEEHYIFGIWILRPLVPVIRVNSVATHT